MRIFLRKILMMEILLMTVRKCISTVAAIFEKDMI